MNNIEDLNRKFEFKSVGVFPFINLNSNTYTILKKGYYKKHNAKYRGLSFIYDKNFKKFKAILIGYFYVPEDYIIVPENLQLSDIVKNFIKDYENDGFKKINNCPSLKPIEFDENSEEYFIAKENHENYDKISN